MAWAVSPPCRHQNLKSLLTKKTAARGRSEESPHHFVIAPKEKDFIGVPVRPHEGSNIQSFSFSTALKRQHRRTIGKRDQSPLIMLQRYKLVKQFVNTKFV